MDIPCNTLQFHFPRGTAPPTWDEIAAFVKRLNSDPMQMEVVYKLPQSRVVCIKYISEDAMKKSIKDNADVLKFYYMNGQSVDVSVSIAGRNVTYVRVFDLPPEVSDNDLSTVLGNFGKVGRVIREKFPAGLGLDHLFTGVRGVYVDVEEDIPAALEIGKWKVRVFHEGLKDRCFSCNKEGHRKHSCPEKKLWKKNVKKNPVSYAGIVACGSTALMKETDLVEEDEEIIEVLEDEVLETENVDHCDARQDLPEQSTGEEQTGSRREWAIAELTKFANRVQEAVNKQQASERRAQFAASGSTEMLRPKKTARKSSK